ncbi:hypothetical protein ACI0X9_003382 [Cronobacter turicensis]
MLYMFLCIVVMGYLMWRIFSSFKDILAHHDDLPIERPHARFTMIMQAGTICVLMPVWMTIFSDSVSATSSTIAQYVGLAGALILLVASLLRFLKNRAIMGLVMSLTGLALAGLYANSLLFVADENTGLLNYAYLENVIKIKEPIDCESGMMVIRLEKRDTPSQWRCPKSIVLIGNSSHPFLPWPDYTTGKSVSLTNAVRDMMDVAENNLKKARSESDQKP